MRESLYLCPSPERLLGKLVFTYLRHGYCRVSVSEIPEGKESRAGKIDRSIIRKHRVTSCRTTRANRRKKGEASVMYLRYGRTVLLMATDGETEQEGRVAWKDLREGSVTLFGYRVHRMGRKATAEVSPRTWKGWERIAEKTALHQEEKVKALLERIDTTFPLDHPGVRKQKERVLKAVNAKRRKAGLSRIGKNTG